MALFSFKSKKDGDAAPDAVVRQPGFIARLRSKLNRGDSWLTYDLANLLPGGRIDDAVLDELEMRLIAADVGIETTEKILGGLRGQVSRKELGQSRRPARCFAPVHARRSWSRSPVPSRSKRASDRS